MFTIKWSQKVLTGHFLKGDFCATRLIKDMLLYRLDVRGYVKLESVILVAE